MFSTVDEHPTEVYVEKVRAQRIEHDRFALPGGHGQEDSFGDPGDWLVVDWRGRRSIVSDGEFKQRFEATGEHDDTGNPKSKAPEPSETGDDSDGNTLAFDSPNLAGQQIVPPADDRAPHSTPQAAHSEDQVRDTDTSAKTEDQNTVEARDAEGNDAGIPSTGQELRAADTVESGDLSGKPGVNDKREANADPDKQAAAKRRADKKE